MGGQGSGRKPNPLKQYLGEHKPNPSVVSNMNLPNYSGVKKFVDERNLFDNDFLKLDGSNANTNIDIGAYNFTATNLSTDYFLSNVSPNATLTYNLGDASHIWGQGYIQQLISNSVSSSTISASSTITGQNDIRVDSDSYGVVLGEGQDVRIRYNGSDTYFTNLNGNGDYHFDNPLRWTSVSQTSGQLIMDAQIDLTGTNGYGSFQTIDMESGDDTITSFYGNDNNIRFHISGSGTGGATLLNNFRARTSAKWNAGGTIDEWRAYDVFPNFSSTWTGQLTKWVGYNIPDFDASVINLDNVYGIYLGDISGADLKNFAIKTGLGDVSIGDDLYFENDGSGLCFAEIYCNDESTADTIASSATYTKFARFDTNGASNNCTADQTNNKITTTKAGIYKVSCMMDGYVDTANVQFDCAVFYDGTIQNNIKCSVEFVAVNKTQEIFISGFIDAGENKDIDVRFRQQSGGNVDATIVNANLNVVQIGGT